MTYSEFKPDPVVSVQPCGARKSLASICSCHDDTKKCSLKVMNSWGWATLDSTCLTLTRKKRLITLLTQSNSLAGSVGYSCPITSSIATREFGQAEMKKSNKPGFGSEKLTIALVKWAPSQSPSARKCPSNCFKKIKENKGYHLKTIWKWLSNI